MTKLWTTTALVATIAASLPGAARACESIASMSARINGGSAIGGVPCLPATPSAPAINRLPSGVSGGGAGAVMGAVGAAAGILGVLQSLGGSDAPTAPVASSPQDPFETQKAALETRNAAIAPYQQAAADACVGPAESLACRNALIAQTNIEVQAYCSPDIMAATQDTDGTMCQSQRKAAQQFFSWLATHPLQQPSSTIVATTTPGPTGINSADVPNYIDTTTGTYHWSDGTSYQAHPGDVTSPGAQRLCRAGYTNACPGGSVQLHPSAPAAPSRENDYQAAAWRQYEQAQRQYEQAQQLYQSNLRAGNR